MVLTEHGGCIINASSTGESFINPTLLVYTIEKQNFWVTMFVDCREVFDTVSLSRQVCYPRFYCSELIDMHCKVHINFLKILSLQDVGQRLMDLNVFMEIQGEILSPVFYLLSVVTIFFF